MKAKKCKVCSTKFEPLRPLQMVCSPQCGYEYANKQKDIDWKQRKAKMKTDLMTRSDYLDLTRTAFNTYIRARDKGLTCISCGKLMRQGNIDAGHLWSAGGHSNIRFNEYNVNAQCSRPCNKDLSGDPNNYRIGFIKKYGAEKLAELDAIAHVEKKWDIEELKKMIVKYKKLTKKLAQE